MRLGLSSYLFRWAVGTSRFRPAHPLTPLDLVNATADFGAEVLQLSDQLQLEAYSEAELQVLGALARERRVALELGTTGCMPERLDRYRRLAVLLGAPLVRLVLDSEDAPLTRSAVVATLREAGPAYRRSGLTLAIENHFRLSSPSLIAVIEQVADPAVAVCLDTANSIGAQEWPRETIPLLAPYAVNVHLKDYRVAPHPDGVGVVVAGAPLGQGQQDVSAVLAAIDAAGRRPTIVLEQWSPRQQGDAATLAVERAWAESSIVAARAYLRDAGHKSV